jgi:DNA-binding GntR family transcriptional regulator
MSDQTPTLDDMNARSREVFRRVVEGYLETGVPVGSRTLTQSLSEQVSAATIRSVMQDLEQLGLIGSPHIRMVVTAKRSTKRWAPMTAMSAPSSTVSGRRYLV